MPWQKMRQDILSNRIILYFVLLSQNFCFQVFDEAKIIFKLDLRDQLKNVCFDLLSKIRKQ